MPPVLVVLIALAAPAADPPARAVIAQRAPTPAGPTGLDRIWSADLGPPGTYRLRFTLSHFETADFPLDGANDVFTATDFAFAATPLPFLEPFLALRGTSNANDGERPRVFQSLGDLTIGLKSGADVTPWLSLGGAATVRVVSALGGGGFDFDATSYELRALATFDALRGLDLPARFLIDLSYTFENSEALYAGLPQEPTVVQEFGLQAGRYDRFLIGLGLEVPFVEECSAYIEYRLGTPFQVELTRRGAGSDEFSFGALPHTFTPGLRAFPLPELAVDFAVRFGLSDAVYTGVPATPPWEMVIGLAYTLDPRPIVKTETVERVVEAPPTTGALGGQVLDATTKKPISGARVDYTDAGRAAQLTDAEGRFAGYLLPAGAHALRVSAEGYHPATANAMVLAGGDVVLDVALTADPAARKPAEPPPPAECPPAAPAKPAKPEKPEKPERLAPERPARKPRGLVDVSPKRIRLRRGLTFTPGTAKLTAADREVLDALAKALADQPKINRVRIAAHTDNRGEHDALIRLSNDRARSVQSYLVQRGVAAARLQARGFGPDKPVAPNLTARGRARNDRVEFLVLSGR